MSFCDFCISKAPQASTYTANKHLPNGLQCCINGLLSSITGYTRHIDLFSRNPLALRNRPLAPHLSFFMENNCCCQATSSKVPPRIAKARFF
jgi:hypothetical protein